MENLDVSDESHAMVAREEVREAGARRWRVAAAERCQEMKSGAEAGRNGKGGAFVLSIYSPNALRGEESTVVQCRDTQRKSRDEKQCAADERRMGRERGARVESRGASRWARTGRDREQLETSGMGCGCARLSSSSQYTA